MIAALNTILNATNILWCIDAYMMVTPSLLCITHKLCVLFLKINALRVAINTLACEGPGGTLHLGPDRISALQEDCRERLIRCHLHSHTENSDKFHQRVWIF